MGPARYTAISDAPCSRWSLRRSRWTRSGRGSSPSEQALRDPEDTGQAGVPARPPVDSGDRGPDLEPGHLVVVLPLALGVEGGSGRHVTGHPPYPAVVAVQLVHAVAGRDQHQSSTQAAKMTARANTKPATAMAMATSIRRSPPDPPRRRASAPARRPGPGASPRAGTARRGTPACWGSPRGAGVPRRRAPAPRPWPAPARPRRGPAAWRRR